MTNTYCSVGPKVGLGPSVFNTARIEHCLLLRVPPLGLYNLKLYFNQAELLILSLHLL